MKIDLSRQADLRALAGYCIRSIINKRELTNICPRSLLEIYINTEPSISESDAGIYFHYPSAPQDLLECDIIVDGCSLSFHVDGHMAPELISSVVFFIYRNQSSLLEIGFCFDGKPLGVIEASVRIEKLIEFKRSNK